MKKYGIMVPVDGHNLWVTDGKDKPLMFDSINEANEAAKGVWKTYTIKRIPKEIVDDKK
jgi:hypothetical protein